ncbi:hypothetical protein [uncultured Propionibacterium sp.]|nr:hypothetical protein [uncultured Propionibacterium sp.]
MNIAILLMREIRGLYCGWLDPLILFSPPAPVFVVLADRAA